MDRSWAYLIPKGEDSVVVLDPADQNAPPLIAFRRAIAKDRVRLDPALLKAFETFELWQSGRIVEDYRPHSRPATNFIPAGRHVTSLVNTLAGCGPYSTLVINVCAFIPSFGAPLLLNGVRAGSTYVPARDANGMHNRGLLTDGRGFSRGIAAPGTFRFFASIRVNMNDGTFQQASRRVADDGVDLTTGADLCPPSSNMPGSVGFTGLPAPSRPGFRTFSASLSAISPNRCPRIPFLWTASAILTVTASPNLSRASVRLTGTARTYAIESFVASLPTSLPPSCNTGGIPILTRILNPPSTLLDQVQTRPFDGVAELT